MAEREKRRIERRRVESRLDVTKTPASFEFAGVPMLSKAHVMALASGDSWLEKGASILILGPPGVGKSHVGCGIGHALIEAVACSCAPAICRRASSGGLGDRWQPPSCRHRGTRCPSPRRAGWP